MESEVFSQDELAQILKMPERAPEEICTKLVRTMLTPHCDELQVARILKDMAAQQPSATNKPLEWRPKTLKNKLDVIIEESGGDSLIIEKVLTLTTGDMTQWRTVYMSPEKIRSGMRAIAAYAAFKKMTPHDYVAAKRGGIFTAPTGYC